MNQVIRACVQPRLHGTSIKSLTQALSLSKRNAFMLIIANAFVTHLIFNQVEPRRPAAILPLLFVLPGLLSLTLLPYFNHWISAVVATLLTFHAVLSSSVVAYRLSPFHPLARYPGPTLDKISQILVAWMGLKGKRHVYDYDLHQKYGDVVRIGPNEVSINDPLAISPLYGVQGLPKGPLADVRLVVPEQIPSLINIRDRHQHAQRRIHWLRGLNAEALRGYEPIINKRIGQLVELLRNSAGKTVDLSRMLSLFSYDFMTDMAFGGGIEMMRDGDVRGLWKLQGDAIAMGTFASRIPWIARFQSKLTLFMDPMLQFRQYGIAAAERRLKMGSQTKDLFYHLIDEGGVDKQPPSLDQIVADGALAIVAGSDTTASTLSNLFFFLMADPEAHSRLQTEIDEFYPADEDSLSSKFHGDMPYLAACINESLRLYPVVPSGSQRACFKGMGAKMIGPHYIPEGTAVSVNSYVIHRDPRNFSPRPNDFWPERWLLAEGEDPVSAPSSHPSSAPIVPRPKGFIHNMDAFIPFSYGPANCVGKFLALKEMKTVVCHIMQNIDMKFADGYDPARWHEEMKSLTVLKRGALPLSVRLRKV